MTCAHTRFFVVLTVISGIGKNSTYLDRRIKALEYLVVFKQHGYGLYCEKRVELSVESGLIIVIEDEMSNLRHAGSGHLIYICIPSIIFHKEAKHVFVCDCVLDKIFMQALAENLFGCLVLFGVIYKYRRSCETEDLQVVEEINNILVAVTEVGTVALIENHYHFLVLQLLQMFVVVVLFDGGIQFLDSSNNDFIPAFKTMD